MEVFLQSFKDVFLLLTTFGFILISLRNSYKGLLFYMACLVLCALTGFERAIYYEGYLVPTILLLKILYVGKCKPDPMLFFLFIYIIAVSLINRQNPFPKSNPIYFGLVLLIIKGAVIDNEKKRIWLLIMLWGYVLAKMIWYIIYAPAPFTVQLVNERLLEVDSMLVTDSESFRGGLDPNYFGYMMGTGFLLSLIGVANFRNILPYVRYAWVKYVLLIIASLELFFSLKGLSRGVFLAEAGAIVFMLILSKGRTRRFAILGITAFVGFVILSGVWDMLYSRFIASNSASRFSLAKEVLISLYSWNGTLGCLLGGGTDFPWNNYSKDPFLHSFELYSTHNSWLKFIIDYGLLGFGILLAFITKKLKHLLKTLKVNWLSQALLVMFIYFSLVSMSLEPLQSFFGWLLFVMIL